MEPQALQLEWYTSFDDPGLEPAWIELSRCLPDASLFSSYHWCRCWWETVGREAIPMIGVVREPGGHTVGLAPLCIQRQGAVRWLSFMGRERVSGDHLDLLARPEDRPRCLAVILPELERRSGEYDGLLFGELHPDSPTRAGLIAWARRNRFALHEREQRRVPYIELPKTYDELLASLSSNMRYHVRRRRRGLHKDASARVELVREGARIHAVLDEFFELHRRRWETEGLPGNFRDPAMQAFLHRFCSASAGCDGLRLFVLSTNGAIQAVLICFHHRDTASYYQMGWAPDCRIESPGIILLSHSIEQAIAEGLRRYDFLRGEEAYKFRWTNTCVEQSTLLVGCSVAARAAVTAGRAKNLAKRAISQCFGAETWERARRAVHRVRQVMTVRSAATSAVGAAP